MTLNKNSWHYKVWRNTYGQKKAPEKTNLCAYLHRTFWLGIVAQIILIPLRLMGLTIAFIFGCRPDDKIKDYIIGNTHYNFVLESYRDFTFSDDENGTPVGIVVWGTILGCLLLYAFILGVRGALQETWSTYLLLGSVSLLAICGLITLAQKKLEQNETAQLALNYIKAKKEKVCPIVTFSDQPSDLKN